MRGDHSRSIRFSVGGFIVLCASLIVPVLAVSRASATPLTALYTFPGGSNGANPTATLIFDSAGNLYGTTQKGGSYGFGVVFELSPPIPPATQWIETVLHSFGGAGTDGAFPAPHNMAVIQDASHPPASDAAWYSSFRRPSHQRRNGPKRCSTPLPAAVTGLTRLPV